MKNLIIASAVACQLAAGISYPAYAEVKLVKNAAGKYKLVSLPDEKLPVVAGFTSAIVPGTGQAINGNWGKAAAFFGTEILLFFAWSALSASLTNSSNTLHPAGALALLANMAYSSYDAAAEANATNEERAKYLDYYQRYDGLPDVENPFEAIEQEKRNRR